MTNQDRMFLIRKGNELFNDGKIETAKKYFIKANYQDGMLRVANYYFYEKKLPLNALPLYMKCGAKEKVSEIYQRMAFALGTMLSKDTEQSQESSEPQQNGEISTTEPNNDNSTSTISDPSSN